MTVHTARASMILSAALAITLPAAPALAELPDFEATPYECSGYEPETNSCLSISTPTFLTPASGTATSRAMLVYNTALLSIGGEDREVTFAVTVTGDFELGSDDTFCTDYGASEITVEPGNAETPQDLVDLFAELFSQNFRAAGYRCAIYERQDGNLWTFYLLDENGEPAEGSAEAITMFDAEAGAALTLRPQ